MTVKGEGARPVGRRGAAGGAPRRLWLGRLPIDAVTFAEALDRIEALVSAGRGGAVFTPNVDHVVKAEHDPELRAAYAAASLSLADGTPVVWASRLLRPPLPEKVSGSDLVVPLAERAARRGWRVYLLGGAAGAAERAAAALASRHGTNVVGTEAPVVTLEPRGDATSRAIVERIRGARPDLVLVAFGAPKQEIWIHRHAAALRPAVAIGVGASLDFLAGAVPRAPAWMSRTGLEWLYRLGREPRRLWRRYLVEDPEFALVLVRTWWRARRGAAGEEDAW
jgi:N-acetylglucosaminyldiphosphoundecaprenol N-acetyl-beta-D-mannosaminyltransferase